MPRLHIECRTVLPESPDEVAERLRTVLRYASPEKVYINPDCGFGWSPRNMTVDKAPLSSARS